MGHFLIVPTLVELFLLMKLMLLVAKEELALVVDTMKENKHLTNYLLKWMDFLLMKALSL